MATRIYIEDGGIVPFWYGFAYMDFDRDASVFYIMPLNIIVWLWYNHIRYKIKYPPRDKELERTYQMGYRDGINRYHY